MIDLFGTSGVRGLVGEKINPELMIDLSKSIAQTLDDENEVLIGRDSRTSGEMIENALTSGFLSSGLDVGKMGKVPTPVVGFSTRDLRANVGVMVTASHNPSEYNGIKLFDSKGMAFNPEREDEIESIYSKKRFKDFSWKEIGKLDHYSVLNDYINNVRDYFALEEEHKVVIDCANGPSSRTTPKLLRMLGCNVVTINSHLDGFFPGREAEPVEENLENLKKFVKKSNADLGIAHDGDGDRMVAIDETGRLVNHDKLLALFARYSVERFGGDVVTTVDASKVVDEMVSEVGGRVLRTKVGDVNVAEVMDSEDAKFGGEPSGSWILGDIHMCPDGTISAARVLEMIEEYGDSMSGLLDSVPEYPIVRDKIRCPEEDKGSKMSLAKKGISSEFDDIKNLLTKDGIRVETEDGNWLLIRPSGTEPYIRFTSEADDMEEAERMITKAKEVISG